MRLVVAPGPDLSRFDSFQQIGPRSKWDPTVPINTLNKIEISVHR